MIKTTYIIAGWMCACSFAYAQSERGLVQDAATQEALPGAVVEFLGTKKIIVADAQGYFYWASDSTTTAVEASHQGYKPARAALVKNKRNIISLQEDEKLLDEAVLIRATRAAHEMPIAQTTVEKLSLRKQSFAQDMPLLLNWTPSIVTTSDAGNGVGYTGLRIRGSDPARVNVTVNGIPLNDSESQGVFWVNIPDISSSTQNVQIQRGVGTSSNGGGAFGASVNVLTNNSEQNPFLQVTNAFGSYNTRRHMISVGTGINNGFSAEGRLSLIKSDGYIDRAASDLQSYYVSASYFGKSYIVKALAFGGHERTFQSWNGVPEARLNNDTAGMKETAEANGFSQTELDNLLNSNRRYNRYTYPNQVDDYRQQHSQLHFSKQINAKNALNISLHHTFGAGYYEEYKYDDRFSEYGLSPVVLASKDTIKRSDLVRQRWLKNHFYGLVFSHEHKSDRATFTIGGEVNHYIGDHYAYLIWGRVTPVENDYQYYFNQAHKITGNIYAKLQRQLSNRFSLFVDMQARHIQYKSSGPPEDGRDVNIDKQFSFFNPKAGLTYKPAPGTEVFAYFGVGHRDPVRNDFINSLPNEAPKAERLYDWEAGYRWQKNALSFSVNGYYMHYKDQLIPTGALNFFGESLRLNVPQSYRMGIEAESNWRFASAWQWNANVTLSRNKVKEFNEVIYDGSDATAIAHADTDIAYSPSVIAGSGLVFQAARWLSIAWMSKYVGKQYMDNTMQTARSIAAYWVNDLRLQCSWKLGALKELSAGLLVNNFLNRQYSSNGYTWGYLSGGRETRQNWYFPQAPINFMVIAGLRF